MGLGVLQAREEHVPGTSYVYEKGDSSTPEAKQAREITGVKYDNSGPVPIILVPQPSDDPNDPLNWPLWKRDLITLILCLVSVLASTLSPLLAANSLTLVFWFGINFEQVALLTGFHLLGVGVAGFIFVASARVWGKRHLYLLGTIIIIISSIWGGLSGLNYTSLAWARVFQGVGLAPFEALVNASVGDLYFVHQRGKRMAATNMALFGGAFFTPILVGKITDTLGWQWTFYLLAIFTGAMLPIVFLFVPETAFRRDEKFNTDFTGEKIAQAGGPMMKNEYYGSVNDSPPSNSIDMARDAGHNAAIPQKDTFVQSLRIFNGRKSDENIFKLVLRPFPLFLHPAIFWGCLIQGTMIGWTVFIGVVLAAIFLGPPLWFDEVATGYMYTGPFLGALLGFILAGLLSDWSTKVMIRLNGGVYEPEFRIILVIPQLIFGCAGLYGFGQVSANPSGWFLPDFFFALEVMGMVLGAVASALYIVDAHRELAVEAFTCLLIFKNIFSFGLTYGAYGWLVQDGVSQIFLIIASIQVGICFLSVPMYIFGKRNRAFMQRHDILKMTHLD